MPVPCEANYVLTSQFNSPSRRHSAAVLRPVLKCRLAACLCTSTLGRGELSGVFGVVTLLRVCTV